MRDTKFRAIRKKGKPIFKYFMLSELLRGSVVIFPEDYHISQDSELRDINGCEIYEDDVVIEENPRATILYLVSFGKYDNEEAYEDNISGYGWYSDYWMMYKDDRKVYRGIGGVDGFEENRVLGSIYTLKEMQDIFKGGE